MGLPIHCITVLGTWAASLRACSMAALRAQSTHTSAKCCGPCSQPAVPMHHALNPNREKPTHCLSLARHRSATDIPDQIKRLSTAVNRNKRSTKFNQPLAKATQPLSGIPTQMRNPPRHVQGLRANPVSFSRKVLRLSAEVCWHVTLNQGEDIEMWGPVF